MSDESDLKKVSIIGTTTRYQIKKVTQNKEINKERKKQYNQLDYQDDQFKVITQIHEKLTTEDDPKPTIFLREINNKINGYKQQDVCKNMLDVENFVSLEQVIYKIYNSKLKCYYCSEPMLILYKYVKEKRQWTLDRINNDLGHNCDNVIISCLECNLQRRRKTKDAFAFTKQLILTRDEY
jgi:hypothetical protein